jgi:ABC-type spermidine/putrescine transport system permease subunit II
VPRSRVQRGVRAKYGFTAWAIVVFAFLYLPILVMAMFAFNRPAPTSIEDFRGSNICAIPPDKIGNIAVWNGVTTCWFSAGLHDRNYVPAIRTSLEIAAETAIIATALGLCAALALARMRPRYRVPFDVIVYLTLVVPEIVIAVSTLIFFVNLSFDLGPVTMFLGHTVFNASLVMLIVRARFVSMGYSLEEASMDLGASRIGTFRQVTLPRLAPAIVAGLLLSFTFSFDDVVISNFTAGAGNDTWPLRVLAGLRFGLRPDLNATATMMLAVTLVGLTAVALVLRRAARTQGVSPDVIAASA